MSQSMPVLLAIDFGTQRIGLAISRGTLAEPLKIIENTPQAISEIQRITSDECVEKIIVGISENEMAEKTRQFVLELQKHITLPVEFTDETLSSHTVHQKMQSAPKSKRGQHIDHLAAAEFLQEYLDYAS
jgi:putative transcription antitermination factor YqgF